MRIIKCAGMICVAIFMIASFSSCSNEKVEKAKIGEPVLARVNDRVITPTDFLITRQILYFPSERARYSTPEGEMALLKHMVGMELFYQEGLRQQLDEDPQIKAAVENFRRYLIYYVMITRNITPENIKDYFQRNFYHVAVIKLDRPRDASDSETERIRERAGKILEKLRSGADFGELAKKYSASPGASNGGDPGVIGYTGEWPAEVLQAAASLRNVGDISGVVEAGDGFYILKLIEPHGRLDLSGLTDRIQELIYNTMVRENYKNYVSQLQVIADIEFNPENLKYVSPEKLEQYEAEKISVPTIPPPGVPEVKKETETTGSE